MTEKRSIANTEETKKHIKTLKEHCTYQESRYGLNHPLAPSQEWLNYLKKIIPQFHKT